MPAEYVAGLPFNPAFLWSSPHRHVGKSRLLSVQGTDEELHPMRGGSEERRLCGSPYRNSKSMSQCMNSLSRFIQLVVGIVLLLVWTILGFFVGVSLVVRQMAVYSVALAASSLGNGNEQRAKESLDKAIGVWPLGYRKVMTVFNADRPELEQNGDRPFARINYLQLGLVLLWTFVFWGGLWMLVSFVFSPWLGS